MTELTDRALQRLRAAGLGDTLGGRLELIREVGAGGMGRVLEARDPASGRRLAVKLLSLDAAADASRFAAEAEMLERLDHPAIVAHVQHGTTASGEPYLAMEWLDGLTLAERLRGGPLSWADAVRVGLRVADGLAAAHRAGMVHRDVKPSNIVLVGDRPDRATIIDFGVARRPRGELHLTRTGDRIGTPGYMAPEQAAGSRELDGRADLFGLGCVLHQALTGTPPFPDGVGDPRAAAPRVSSLRRDVPRRLDELVARLLAPRAADRPSTADEVMAELEAIRDSAHEARARVRPAAAAHRSVDEQRAGSIVPRSSAAGSRALRVIALACVLGATAAAAAALRGEPDGPARAPCDRDRRPACAARCASGDAAACFREGEALAFGTHGRRRDPDAALILLERACHGGAGRACYDAASLRERRSASRPGALAEIDRLLEAGCAAAFAPACRKLAGDTRRSGAARPGDPERAVRWLARACGLGDAKSCRQEAELREMHPGTDTPPSPSP